MDQKRTLLTCPICGANLPEGVTCREQFESLLVFDFQEPGYGEVHFHTVTCYNLQHPADYDLQALKWLKQALHGAVNEGWTTEELRRRSSASFEGQRRVRKPSKDRTGELPYRVNWSMTVADIDTTTAETYHNTVFAWSRAILKDLEGVL